MLKNTATLLALGGAVRYFLATSQYGNMLANRVEISTPLNSFKRAQEGVFLYNQHIDPYSGDIVHETPWLLLALVQLHQLPNVSQLLPLLYVLFDLVTALMLYKMSKLFIKNKLQEQRLLLKTFAADTAEIQYQPEDMHSIPRLVLLAYLFNPLSVFNCAGMTSTVFSNFLLSATLFCLLHKWVLPCLLCLALESLRNLYPVVLIAPVVLVFAQGKSKVFAAAIVALFVVCCAAVAAVNFSIMQSWSYLDGTLGFIFFYRDLQPNIGLFWYFFTEMFEHFRTMFLITFQMNATVLYLIPLTLKLRKEPLLLATVLITLAAIFRSYPCLGDVSYYLALMPLWKRCWKFMAHNFVVVCFFIVTLCMLPALWHLWIFAGSANANFYFGITLAFSTGQIFLCTDLLFAHVKREFCLRYGQRIFIQGKEAKIVLE